MPDHQQAPLPEDMLYDRRNAFLDLVLGLISLSERTVSTVAQLAEPLPPPPRDPARSDPPVGPILR
ncbi:hypothetical protein [Allopontixanthobacter sediminis]|uniref:Uncharacterized protein n=1 Tax=Allopontixanthobacter sediminis TaxID=1689985 RepID=A0A845AY06_9SPHN|nr:hypothetical protein [Allopontixanthobacter sediminis]MXP42838.1 hypothetical protein [Allopontixanthobacter sediminis]